MDALYSAKSKRTWWYYWQLTLWSGSNLNYNYNWEIITISLL
jgi:hypothetical protein